MTLLKNIQLIFNRDTFIHLRLPFSYFLLPVFCFGISQTLTINIPNLVIVFIALHFFIYPGSNIYNSFMDEDKGSIGGLEHPPPVTKNLFYASIIFDIVGLLLCMLTGWEMTILMLIYIGVSKAYSWKKIRLKKYGITGWFIVMIFQGGYTFLLVNMSIENNFNYEWFNYKNLECMLIASLLIGGFYPMTQIYQHEEDAGRGDLTISYKLGVKGTFLFSGLLFFIASIIFYHYFQLYYTIDYLKIYFICLIPAIFYFFYWFFKSITEKKNVNFKSAMRMTFISSTCMIIFFTILFYLNHYKFIQ